MEKFICIYLDTDTSGGDLLDSAGNNITAGYYVYRWPLTSEPVAGPFETLSAAQQAE